MSASDSLELEPLDVDLLSYVRLTLNAKGRINDALGDPVGRSSTPRRRRMLYEDSNNEVIKQWV